MDTYYGIPNSTFPKRSSLSPIQNYGSQNPYYHQPAYISDPYTSPDGHTTVLKSLNSPYLRYMQNAMASPMSAAGDYPPLVEYKYHHSSGIRGGENLSRIEITRQPRSPLPYCNTTPAKGEEGVLVMDGVLVKNQSSDRSRSSSLSLTDSGSSSSSSSSGKNYKHDLFRYGTKGQFANGNKELHSSPVSYKSSHETPCKNYTSGTCSFGSKCRFLHHETSTTKSPTMTTSAIIQDEPTSSNIVKLTSINWVPSDDGINIQPAASTTAPSDEDFEACMNNVLYGPRRNKRLPVFCQICPE